MAPKIIRISRFFVKKHIGLNLQLYEENQRKHGRINSINLTGTLFSSIL